MIKQIAFLVAFFSVVAFKVQAQTHTQPQTQTQSQTRMSPAEEKLNSLLNEREQLVMEYQFLNQQNSNFWGKKSKDDLMSIIETLKKIINTDSEIIAAVKEVSLRRLAENTAEIQREGQIMMGDERNISAQMEGYQSEIRTLQSTLKKSERSIKELETQLADTKEIRYGKDKVIAIMAVVAFILLLYAVFLQVRLNKKPGKAKKKKV